jgi:hypothetical protein
MSDRPPRSAVVLAPRLTALALALAACGSPELHFGPDAVVVDAGRRGAADAGRFPTLPPDTVVRADAAVAPDFGSAVGEARPGEGDACFEGAAAGVACTPDGTPIAGARVAAQSLDCRGLPLGVETVSEADGSFILRRLAPGPTALVVQSGRFLASATVDVPERGTAFAGGGNGKLCFEADAARIAVATGYFDHAESILQGMGFAHDRFCGRMGDAVPTVRLLQDPERLSTYDILVLNCGSGVFLRSSDAFTRQMIENLRGFVRAGGSIYVSDLASDFVEVAWPDIVRFAHRRPPPADVVAPRCCTCGETCPAECPLPAEPELCGVQRPVACRSYTRTPLGGGQMGHVEATLVSPFLQLALGGPSASIEFDLSGWMQIDTVVDGVEVLATGRAPGEDVDRPLMVLFRPEPGGGLVAYTSFHTSAQANATIDALIRALLLRL